MALGVLRALSEHGRRVPDDISIVGFDDIPESAYFTPPLTTVRQDFGEVGRRSLRALLSQIDGRAGAAPQILIDTRLIVRQSSAVPQA
jgi:DNA-binding LacI/PurR family transcriptional regulator